MHFHKPTPPGRAPTIMRASHLMTRILVVNFSAKPGGGFGWPVRFELQSSAVQDGFIIQEIHIENWTSVRDEQHRTKGYIEKKKGSTGEWELEAAPEIHYWEAWPVKQGTQYVDWGGRLTYCDDEYHVKSSRMKLCAVQTTVQTSFIIQRVVNVWDWMRSC